MAKVGFPPGAVVLVDGRRRCRVVEHCPEGSTSLLFPHYRLTEGGWNAAEHAWIGEVFAVATERVGVSSLKPARR